MTDPPYAPSFGLSGGLRRTIGASPGETGKAVTHIEGEVVMRRIGIVFLCVLFILGACQKPAGLEGLFPERVGTEWKRTGSIEAYGPGTLFEYIDGEAELYLKYGFVELATAIYEGGEGRSIVLDIYDMGSELNAFGLYSNYRHPRYAFGPFGTEAIVSDYGIRLYHGRYVGELKASEASEAVEDAMMRLARTVTENIGAPAEPPELLSLLPEQGRILKSERYAATEFMQQAFLPRGLEAAYTLGDDEVTGFVVLFDGEEEAVRGLDALKTFYEGSGGRRILARGMEEGDAGFETKYHGYVLFSVAGPTIVGVRDLPHPEVGLGMLARMRENVLAFDLRE